jgi:hypothetical protein
LLISLAWFGDTLFQALGASWGALGQGIKIGAFPVLLVVGIRHLQKHRTKVAVGASRDATPPKKRGLILFLSRIPDSTSSSGQPGLDQLQAQIGGAEVEAAAVGQTLERLGWRIPRKAIDYHLPDLDAVVCLVSEGQEGSARQFEVFKKAMETLLGGKAPGIIALPTGAESQGLDFFDVEEQVNAVEKAEEILRSRFGIKLKNQIVDVTGGTKLSTVAGSMATLGQGRECQYTAPDAKDPVVTFDIEYVPQP